MKSTAKSCSCQNCRRAKRTEGGRARLRCAERKHRHQANRGLRLGRADLVMAAGCGDRVA